MLSVANAGGVVTFYGLRNLFRCAILEKRTAIEREAMSKQSLTPCDEAQAGSETCQERIEETLVEILARMDKFDRAFPDGPEQHRMAHEAMIRAAQAEERFWTELKLDIAKKGLWGLLIIILGLILAGLSAKLGLGAPK